MDNKNWSTKIFVTADEVPVKYTEVQYAKQSTVTKRYMLTVLRLIQNG